MRVRRHVSERNIHRENERPYAAYRRISDSPDKARVQNPWILQVKPDVIFDAFLNVEGSVDSIYKDGNNKSLRKRVNRGRITFFEALEISNATGVGTEDFCVYPNEFRARLDLWDLVVNLHNSPDVGPDTWINIIGDSLIYIKGIISKHQCPLYAKL